MILFDTKIEALEDMLCQDIFKFYIAVDFDGTLCKNIFPEIGEPNARLIQLLIHVQEMGHKLILWTCREDEDKRKYLTEAIEWQGLQGLEFDYINENPEWCKKNGFDPTKCRKIYADIYIDDKAFQFKF